MLVFTFLARPRGTVDRQAFKLVSAAANPYDRAYVREKLKAWALGIAMVVGAFYGLLWLGDTFRTHMLFFAVMWFGAPIAALLLNRRTVSALFTMTGLRRLRATLLSVVVGISFIMFFCMWQVRNKVGHAFVDGYRSWRAEPEVDDTGRQFYPGDDWTARTAWGRFSVEAFEWGLMIAAVGLPIVTYKASLRAVNQRESECTYQDGKLVETHEHRPS